MPSTSAAMTTRRVSSAGRALRYTLSSEVVSAMASDPSTPPAP